MKHLLLKAILKFCTNKKLFKYYFVKINLNCALGGAGGHSCLRVFENEPQTINSLDFSI